MFPQVILAFSCVASCCTLLFLHTASGEDIPNTNTCDAFASADGRTNYNVKPKLALKLTELIEAKAFEEARNASRVGGQQEDENDYLNNYIPAEHAGYITVDKHVGNHLFFWYFRSSTAPLLVWLGDEAGQSAMQGLFWQHEPLKLNPDLKSYSIRQPSLADLFSVVYLDNPVGTGYSYSDRGRDGLGTSTQDHATAVVEFLRQFCELFPQYKKDADVYIGGQSVAGDFAAVVAQKLDDTESGLDINMKGLFLGTPLLKYQDMLLSTAEYAYEMGMISKQTLNDLTFTDFKTKSDKFKRMYRQPYSMRDLSPLDEANPPLLPGGDLYDISGKDSFHPSAIKTAMTSTKLRKALHVGDAALFIPENAQVRDVLYDETWDCTMQWRPF